jgi:steroid delta-isomerase-like uncharacterized protein
MTTTQSPEIAHDASLLAFVEQFGEQWAEAWNSHQPERLLALMTDDIVYDDSAWPKTMHGHGDVREFLAHSWRAFPDLRFELTDGPFLHPGAPRASYFWQGTCTHTGPIDPPGIAPTHRRVEFRGFDLHEYRDGRVSRLVILFDLADFMRQLNLLPASGGRAERVMAGLQRLAAKLPDRRS